MPRTMTAAEIDQLQITLETEIADAIKRFESEAGMCVVDIRIDRYYGSEKGFCIGNDAGGGESGMKPRTMTTEREAEFWRVLETKRKLWLRHKEDDALFERIAKSLKAELNAERAVSRALADALRLCDNVCHLPRAVISARESALAQYAASQPEATGE